MKRSLFTPTAPTALAALTALFCAAAVPAAALPGAAADPAPPVHVHLLTQAALGAPGIRAAPRRGAAAPAWRFGVDKLRIEGGALPSAPEAEQTTSAHASAFVQWQPDRSWEGRTGVRVDAFSQGGGRAASDRVRLDLGDTYLRWRGGDTRVTVGAQTVVWGRVDEIPLIDRVSRVDLTRYLLDDLPERRRPQVALRLEQAWDDVTVDIVALPAFRGAALPDVSSVWSPINRTTGEVIGIASSPTLTALVRGATVLQDDGGSGGMALRLTRTGDPFDMGLTLARTRQSLPYYRVDIGAATLTAVHPYQRFIGVDAEWTTGDLTWRTELGYTAGVPATRPDVTMARVAALDWVGAVEAFPGGGDTRVTLQLVARSLRSRQPLLEIKHYAGVNGEFETSFSQGRWKAAVRFAAGLNVRDHYLGPRLSFVGWEPHEFYVAGHFFDGEARTLGNFHRDHHLIAVGMRTRF